MRIRRALAAGCLAALLGSVSPALAQNGCLSRGEGRQLMEQGLVAPLPEALQRAGLAGRQVVDVSLCQGGGGYVYRIRVLEAGGRVRSVSIPAS